MNQDKPSEVPRISSLDRLGRPMRKLRISVTDRCNLRCTYCMPEKNYTWLERKELLSFEEFTSLTSEFTALGLEQVRLTGGEPLLRRDLPELIARLATIPESPQLAMTTNGSLLEDRADPLRAAGLARITVSLDTLDPSRFLALTGRDEFEASIRGIRAAAAANYESLKLNMVVMRGFNDDELPSMLEFASKHQAELRFIEYMDVGGANRWHANAVVSAREILSGLEKELGPIRALGRPESSSPATRYQLEDGTTFGLIASTTRPFCGQCDRSRITADGQWLTCLYGQESISLREPLRANNLDLVRSILTNGWATRQDRGAEERLNLPERGPLVPLSTLRKKPHLEMHTRGG